MSESVKTGTWYEGLLFLYVQVKNSPLSIWYSADEEYTWQDCSFWRFRPALWERMPTGGANEEYAVRG